MPSFDEASPAWADYRHNFPYGPERGRLPFRAGPKMRELSRGAYRAAFHAADALSPEKISIVRASYTRR